MAETNLSLSLKHPQLNALTVATESVNRAYVVTTAIMGLAVIAFLASPSGPALASAYSLVQWIAIVAIILWILLGLGLKFAKNFCSDELLVNRDGLVLPILVAKLNKVRPWQSWIGVTSASVSGSTPDERTLLLELGSGSHLAVPLANMTPQHIEQLLLSVELWGINCNKAQSLFDFQTELHNQSKGLSQLSYTDMWNEELGRRFSSTNFVPLEPNAELQGGRLKVLRQLAFGGLSAIYLAQDGQKELRVLKEAVVPQHMETTNRDAAEKALQREATILAQLRHPHIVSVVDHFAEGGHHYLLLQHVTGQDLRQLVRQNGPQPEIKVLDWAVQMLSALEYLHNYEPPIIHRDLTPENIVLRNDGTIVIIDFGASNQFIGTMTGTIVGKQAYMPPEQLQGKASQQSDIYAFGGTLHYLLTGKDPVPLSESHPAKINQSISEDMDQIVDRCTKLDTKARYANITEAKSAVVALYSQRGIGKLFSENQ